MSRKGKIRSVPDGVDAKNPTKKAGGKRVGELLACYFSETIIISELFNRKHHRLARHRHSPWFIPRDWRRGGWLKGELSRITRSSAEKAFVCVLPSRCFLTSFSLFSGGGYPSNRRHVGCELLLLESVLIECSIIISKSEREREMKKPTIFGCTELFTIEAYERFVHSMDQ
jgi:hypothetical protein